MTNSQKQTRLNSDPRIRVEVMTTDIPGSITKNILNFDPDNQIVEEDQNKGATALPDKYSNLPHSPNSLFEYKNAAERAQYDMETESEEVQHRPFEQFKKNKSNEDAFITPKKFSSNFQKLVNEKSKNTLLFTSNTFEPLTDESRHRRR